MYESKNSNSTAPVPPTFALDGLWPGRPFTSQHSFPEPQGSFCTHSPSPNVKNVTVPHSPACIVINGKQLEIFLLILNFGSLYFIKESIISFCTVTVVLSLASVAASLTVPSMPAVHQCRGDLPPRDFLPEGKKEVGLARHGVEQGRRRQLSHL